MSRRYVSSKICGFEDRLFQHFELSIRQASARLSNPEFLRLSMTRCSLPGRKALSHDASPEPCAGHCKDEQDCTDADQTHGLTGYFDEPPEKCHAGH